MGIERKSEVWGAIECPSHSGRLSAFRMVRVSAFLPNGSCDDFTQNCCLSGGVGKQRSTAAPFRLEPFGADQGKHALANGSSSSPVKKPNLTCRTKAFHSSLRAAPTNESDCRSGQTERKQ